MPLLLPLAVPFFAVMGALVLMGLAKSMTAQKGSSSSGTFWNVFTGQFYIDKLTGFAADFAHWITSRFAASQLRMLTRWFLAIGTLTLGWFTGNALFAEAVAEALGRLERRGDPKARANAKAAGAAAARAAGTARHALNLGHSNATNLGNYKAHTNSQLKTLHHQTTVALPRDIARVGGRVKPLEREIPNLRERTKALEDGAIDTFKWIRTHPLSAATGVFTGAVAIALARMGFGFLRCNNWKNLGKKITCGMGAWLSSLLDLIATFGLATVAVLDPEALAEATVKAVDVVEPILADILSR